LIHLNYYRAKLKKIYDNAKINRKIAGTVSNIQGKRIKIDVTYLDTLREITPKV